MTDRELAACAECGMPCAPREYHPYAACLMFKACHSSTMVRENLEAVVNHRRTPTGEDARDAERYRWLRMRLAGEGHVFELVEYNADMHPELPRAVDAAIDAAMAKEKA